MVFIIDLLQTTSCYHPPRHDEGGASKTRRPSLHKCRLFPLLHRRFSLVLVWRLIVRDGRDHAELQRIGIKLGWEVVVDIDCAIAGCQCCLSTDAEAEADDDDDEQDSTQANESTSLVTRHGTKKRKGDSVSIQITAILA